MFGKIAFLCLHSGKYVRFVRTPAQSIFRLFYPWRYIFRDTPKNRRVCFLRKFLTYFFIKSRIKMQSNIAVSFNNIYLKSRSFLFNNSIEQNFSTGINTAWNASFKWNWLKIFSFLNLIFFPYIIFAAPVNVMNFNVAFHTEMSNAADRQFVIVIFELFVVHPSLNHFCKLF